MSLFLHPREKARLESRRTPTFSRPSAHAGQPGRRGIERVGRGVRVGADRHGVAGWLVARFTSIAAFCMLTINPSAADQAALTDRVLVHYGLRGACSHFSINETAPSSCDGLVFVDVYYGPRRSINFTKGDVRLTFFLPTYLIPNSRMQIDGVAIRHGPPRPASGTCRFGDPSRGPAVVECEARSTAGTAGVIFRTDGSKATEVKE